jgi:Pentapeptide repeats (8 copies)
VTRLLGRSTRHESLADADLAGADLRDAIFEHVDLNGADLRGARLDGAVLRHCDLSGARLGLARAGGVSLAYTELRGADLSGADLRRSSWTSCGAEGAAFRGAKLDGAALAGCRFDDADFTDASLFKANTLHSVFAGASFEGARRFAWSREIVVELLGRRAADLEQRRYVGALALDPAGCYDEWRAILAAAPEYRRLALDALAAYPASGFARALEGGGPEPAAARPGRRPVL